MSARQAFAEDLRRIGVALIVAGFVGAFLQEKIPAAAALFGIVIGFVGNASGYWLLSKEQAS